MRELLKSASKINNMKAKRDNHNLRNGIYNLLRNSLDILILLIAFIVLFSVARYFELAESINFIIEHAEASEVDEFLFATLVIFVALLAVSIFRTVKLNKEITERSRKEIELKESEERFRSLVEKTNIIPWEADFETRQFTYVGPQAEKILGYPPEEWYEKDFCTTHMHLDDRERTVEDCLASSAQMKDFELEYRMISSDGNIVWVRNFISIISEGGGPEMLRGFMIDITKRKQAELTLAESENRHRTIIEHTHDLIVETDTLGFILYANPQHREMMGYDPGEMKGVNCLEYVHEEDLPMVMSSFQKGLETRESVQTAVYRCMHKNGEWRWLESTGQSFETSKGEVHGVMSSRDVTERIEAEEKSREAEERYRALVEHSYDMIIEVSADGRFLFANRNHETYLGYDSSELIEKSVFDFIHPEDKSFAMGTFMEAARNLTSTVPITFRYRHKDGSWRWLESIGKPFKTVSGEIRGVITSRDITERRLEEEKRREIEERLRTLVEHSYDIIVEASADGRLLYINPAFKDLLGYEPEEVINTDVFENIHEQDRPSVISEFTKTLTNDSAGHAVYRYRHKNGDWYWIESTGNTYRTSGGELRAVIASRDITERKKMEEELLKAQKLESLSVLAGGIAHDFNNLLTIVLGNMNIARMGMDSNDKSNKRLEEAEKAIERATGLTRQLLTFAKGGAPDKKSMSVKELLRESTLFALGGSNVKGQFFINDDLHKLDIDEGQIDQVINNLIINAKQAMAGGGVINVGAENKILESGNVFNLPAGNYVKIYVKDHGIGIPEQYQQRIFDPFFTTKEKGSGLGLATSYSIIKQHKGHIAVRSIPGSETVFTIYLPVSKQGVQTAEEKINIPINGEGNILIVDDDEMIARVLGEITTKLGYTPLIVNTSSEAIKSYSNYMKSGKKFNAVILDLTMPGDLGGKETLKRLKELDPDVKAVITSGYFADGSMSEYIDFGFKAYIPKPYNIQDIGATLHEITSGTVQHLPASKH